MLTPEMAYDNLGKSLFLAEPSLLPELDSWVEGYIQGKSRFTFTETDVLKPLWDKGEDIRLREDGRFRKVVLSHRAAGTQWQLVLHTVANDDLYDLLLDELWDGHDLYRCLENLDRETAISSFHIFYLGDERFLLSQDENGQYQLTLSTDVVIVELTTEQKKVIDLLAPQLLTRFPSDGWRPWTTASILEELKGMSDSPGALDKVVPVALESWLLCQEEWVRVGVDSWLPKSNLPPVVSRHRYAVPPVFSATDDKNLALPTLTDGEGAERDTSQVVEQLVEMKEQQTLNKSVRWRITLRTCHINEGTISVPKEARPFYPRARKLARMIAFPGLWFTEGSDMTIWLDRSKHRLFGGDLQDQFAFLEAGEVLEIEWTAAGLVFCALGVDQKVAEEESRLIDLTQLSQLRSTVLESYRISLRAIISGQNKAMSFQEVYEELCIRQQHKPNRATVRTILSSSPEFIFIKAENKWALNPEVASEEGAKSLRLYTLVTNQIEEESNITQQEAVSLSKMIAINRNHITALRSLYLSERRSDVS